MFFWRKSQRENQGSDSWSFEKKKIFLLTVYWSEKKGEDEESLFGGAEEIHLLWRSLKA